MKKRIHFTGVGGVGMAGVAYLLKKAGHDVSGCDLHSSPRTEWLKKNGVSVMEGHSPSHVTPDLDTCVFTPAVPKDSPEFLAANSANCDVKFRGEVLAEIFNGCDGIAVCGTHGKTTTSTFLAKLLLALGENPSWCIGGETDDFPVAGTGTGPLVVEADESDGTLAQYKARTLVVTSLDYDHPDHFKTYEDYLSCYRKAMDAAAEVIETAELPTDDWPEIRPLVLGEHNVRNARTAIEVALRRGHSREAIVSVLPKALSALPDRRFERIWPPDEASSSNEGDAPALSTRASGHPVIISDYAHHPVELECALSMARALKPNRLRVMFQPHRYSRTKTLLKEFPPALANADEVVLVPVYPAFENPVPGGDIADLYLAFRNYLEDRTEATAGSPCSLILSRNAFEAWRHMFLTMEPGDVIMLLGAGDIVALVPEILREMPSWRGERHGDANPVDLSRFSFFRTGGVSYGSIVHSMPADGRKVLIVGAGSNTWFSDCSTDADIVKAPPECNAAMPGASLISAHPELAFMAGIPGTVGGWAKMNAGAFGDSFGNHIEHVIADGKKIPAEECGFGYRTSCIKGLITEVVLKKESAASVGQTADDFLQRRKKFPPRTCGSVFKNPSPDMSAGKLLEEAGAKTLKVGGASVWSEHANVIKAEAGCSSSDILALARLMAACVRDRFGVTLVPEIRGLET